MRIFNDTRLYFWFAAVTLAVAVILGAVSFYSIAIVEPKASKLLNSGMDEFKSIVGSKDEAAIKAAIDKASVKFKESYMMLRSPQIFARYENFDRFDRVADSVKNTIAYFDGRIYDGAAISPQEAMYLNLLLDRRALGSRLGRNTMFFFLFISLIGWGFYFYEKKSLSKPEAK
jgi:hypothetical protein